MPDVGTQPACYFAIYPTPASCSLPITAFLETALSFAIGSQQADTCLGEGSTVDWLVVALNALGCQTLEGQIVPGRQL